MTGSKGQKGGGKDRNNDFFHGKHVWLVADSGTDIGLPDPPALCYGVLLVGIPQSSPVMEIRGRNQILGTCHVLIMALPLSA